MAKLIVEDSPLSTFLSDLPRILFQYNERRIAEERADIKLDEAREYESQKLEELREYNEAISQKEKEFEWTKMMSLDALNKKDAAMDEFLDVQQNYRNTIGSLPNISDSARSVIDGSYKGEALNFESFMDYNNNVLSTLKSETNKIESDLNILNVEAAKFLNKMTPDYFNVNIRDFALDQPEYEMMEKDFVKAMKLKGIESNAASKVLSNLYYATPLEERLEKGRKELEDQSKDYKESATSNLLSISSSLFPADETTTSQAFKKAIGNENYEILLGIFAQNDPKDVYRQLEIFPMGDGSAGDYLDSLLNRLPKGIAMQITDFMDNMKTYDSIMNPSSGSTLANMQDIVAKMPQGDVRNAIANIQNIVQDLSPEAQLDHFDLLGETLVEQWGITFDSYEKSLQDMLNPEGSSEGNNYDIAIESLDGIAEQLKLDIGDDEQQLENLKNVENLSESLKKLRAEGNYEEADSLLNIFKDGQSTNDNNNTLNEVPLKIGSKDIFMENKFATASDVLYNMLGNIPGAKMKEAIALSPSLELFLDQSKKGSSWKHKKVLSLIEDWNYLIDNNIEAASEYGSFEDFVRDKIS